MKVVSRVKLSAEWKVDASEMKMVERRGKQSAGVKVETTECQLAELTVSQKVENWAEPRAVD